jgi:hypothetical protein
MNAFPTLFYFSSFSDLSVDIFYPKISWHEITKKRRYISSMFAIRIRKRHWTLYHYNRLITVQFGLKWTFSIQLSFKTDTIIFVTKTVNWNTSFLNIQIVYLNWIMKCFGGSIINRSCRIRFYLFGNFSKHRFTKKICNLFAK